MLSGIFLAAGQSQRMGENKLLLPYSGRPLYEHGLGALADAGLDALTVVTACPEIIAHCKARGISFALNDRPEAGQALSIRLGVLQSPKGGYMFFVADQPLITQHTISALINAHKRNERSIIVPVHSGLPGSPTIFPSWLRDELISLNHGESGRDIIKRRPESVIWAPVDGDSAFMDIDTPEEYRRLLDRR